MATVKAAGVLTHTASLLLSKEQTSSCWTACEIAVDP